VAALAAPIALDAVEEIILHHVRLGGAAGLAGNDEQSPGEIDIGFHRAHLCRIGGVEHVQGKPDFLANVSASTWAEARAAHAEHDGVGEFVPSRCAKSS
jgi:hypothetical protein